MQSNIDFLNDNIGESLIKMVMPLFLAMVLMLAYGMVDSLWVGNLLGENGYAALTTASSISILLNAVAMGISNGVSIVISQMIGEGDKEKTDKSIITSLVITGLFAIILTISIEIFLKPLLVMFQTPIEIYKEAHNYLAIFLIGYVSVYMYMQLTSIFRSFGDPIFQMKGMLIGTLINVIIDPIFIHIAGIEGAAWATVISETLCLLYAVVYGIKKNYLKLASFESDMIGIIIKQTVPSCIQNCIPAISSMVMVILINQFNVTTIAAYGVVKVIENIMFYPAMAMNMAMITIIGQCFGAERTDRVKDYMKVSILYGIIIEMVLTILVVVFASGISMAFVREISVAKIVSHAMKIIGVGYIFYMITSIFTAKMSGVGKSFFSMILMIIYYLIIRIPLAIWMVKIGMGVDGIWVAILISHIAATIIAFICNKLFIQD